MEKELLSVYKKRIEGYAVKQKSIARSLSLISVLRLLLFLLFAWFVYSAFKERFHDASLLYAIITIPVFLVLVFASTNLKNKRKFLQQLVLINENEIKTGNGQVSFLDNGAGFSPQKGFAVDLNIFGADSLFHLINRAGSIPGKEQLSRRLISPLLQKEAIKDCQACTRELSGKIEFRQTLLAHTLLLEEGEALGQLKKGIRIDDFSMLKNAFWSVLAFVWPVMGIAITIFCVLTNNFRLMIAFGIAGLLLLSFVFSKVSQLYNHISKRSYLYTQYALCFELLKNEHFTHPYLVQRQKEIMRASDAFRRLSKLGDLFDLRASMLSLLINGLLLSDLLCARTYLRWNERYQAAIPGWLDILGEMELLNSLATFCYNHPAFIFPEPVDEKIFINAQAMGHPLMDETKAVTNDIIIGGPAKLHLITGSNMSGKSTFLRTLGLNMVLAQMGAPVFARTFVFRPVQILTSFHHIDSLAERTSYFYAELRALQSIIESLVKPVPSLILLDEVMRGTNSKDKHDGTASLIKKIIKYPALSLIATHDTELGVLVNNYPADIENFCFESELSDKGLVFDFKKRDGVAQTKNATYLMQQMGII